MNMHTSSSDSVRVTKRKILLFFYKKGLKFVKFLRDEKKIYYNEQQLKLVELVVLSLILSSNMKIYTHTLNCT